MGRKKGKKVRKERYPMIDFLRGVALFLMIIFHLVFDLHFLGLTKITFLGSPYWIGFAKFIVFLFLICVGMGLALAHKSGIQWHLVRTRFFKIGGWALVITIVTYILIPKNFIYFGVLHCIAATSVAGVFFVKRPKLSLFLFFLLVGSDLIFEPTLIPISDWLGIVPADYIPFYPWFGVVLFGIYLESINFHKISINKIFLVKSFQCMGKNSLKIYILHQPILIGTLFFIHKLIGV